MDTPVAPRMGAWIEIGALGKDMPRNWRPLPCMGAWMMTNAVVYKGEAILPPDCRQIFGSSKKE